MLRNYCAGACELLELLNIKALLNFKDLFLFCCLLCCSMSGDFGVSEGLSFVFTCNKRLLQGRIKLDKRICYKFFIVLGNVQQVF
jgi:hypothetical protein